MTDLKKLIEPFQKEKTQTHTTTDQLIVKNKDIGNDEFLVKSKDVGSDEFTLPRKN